MNPDLLNEEKVKENSDDSHSFVTSRIPKYLVLESIRKNNEAKIIDDFLFIVGHLTETLEKE